MSNYNYNEMCRDLGYDPTDPEHIEKMQNDFAQDELTTVGLTEADVELLKSEEPTDGELDEIADE